MPRSKVKDRGYYRLPRPLNKDEVAKLREPGSHPVGGSLYLLIRDPGKAYWVHRFRRRDNTYSSKGFGSYPKVTLAQARKLVKDEDYKRRHGVADVSRNDTQAVAGKLFAVARDEYLDHNASLWGARTRERNRYLLTTFAKALDDTPVSRITTQQIADVLKADDENGKPIWTGPDNNRGGKLRGLIENVINGHVDPNPATWDLLRTSQYRLELKRAEPKGHAAMPASEIPQFVKQLDMKKVADQAVLFTILTGVRKSEAAGATWREFDLVNKRWLIPAARMKNGKDHFVPLSDAAIICLGERGADDAFVFPSASGTKLGNDAMLLSRFGSKFTLHGFRSTFASWAEENGYRTNVIQLALAHRKKSDSGQALGNQDTAYMRATLFDERRKLHDAWAALVISGTR
jgi:integrase